MTILTATELSALVTEFLPVATFADLRELAPPDHQASITVQGGATAGDGSGGEFYWNAASTNADDGIIYFKPDSLTANSAGRWLRLTSFGVNDTTPDVYTAVASSPTSSQFIAGTTTSLTLSAAPGSTVNSVVTFDGVVQHLNTYSLSGAVITFTSPIPSNVAEVQIKRALAQAIGVPDDLTITNAKVASNAAIESSKLQFTPSGSGAVARTVQGKLRESVVSVKDFGAVGDGVTNDTAAIANAKLAANAIGGTLYFPAGTYLTDSIAIGAADWGGVWQGAGTNHSLGATGNPVSIIRLRTSSAHLLSINGVHDWTARGITFDGNLLSTTAVLYFPGTSGVGGLFFEDVQVTKTTPTTGDLIQIAGTIQVDHVTFNRYSLKQSDNGATSARNAIRITNGNALLNVFQDGEIHYADVLVHYIAGSANIINTSLYWWTTRAITIENIVQPVLFDRLYTEQTTGAFLTQLATSGTNSDVTITLRNSTINADATLKFTCQMNVELSGNFFGGNVTIDSPLAQSTKHVFLTGPNGFVAGKGFVLTDTGGVGGTRLLGLDGATPESHVMRLGGAAASVLLPAALLRNNRMISWQDSAGASTNAGFIWYDSSNILNFGAANNTRLQITSAGAIRGLGASNGPVGTATLTANAASTVISNTAVTASSVILLSPTSANAAADIAAGNVYVSAKTAATSFTITHPNNANADKTFNYVVLN